MSGPSSIFLVGLSGSGKSTVGRLLASRLQLPFFDTDLEIERETGRRVTELFADEGEARFRQRETATLTRLVQRSAVIGTGGGLPLAPHNRELMRANGTAFWLDASTAALLERLRGETDIRPLLRDDPEGTLEQLRKDRREVYADCGDRMDTADRAPTAVVEGIVRRLKSGGWTARRWESEAEPPIWLDTGTHSYGVYVGSGLLARLPDLLQRHGLTNRLHVIADERVAAAHDRLIKQVLSGIPHTWHQVPSGEQHKSLAEANRLYDELLAERPERGDLLLALGGGVVGDLVGFVAATLLRGVRFVQIPTTVLSMVDSSVGGKVAVDHERGKNLIGAFHQPSLVLADLDFLTTLPDREVPAGLSEIVKIAVMQDSQLFDQIEGDVHLLQAREPRALGAAIHRAIELKARLVEQDERDLTGARALLNYGHTLGQALEAATGYERFLHGEAIAIGMGAAARMSSWLGLHPTSAVTRQDQVLDQLGLPKGAPGASESALRAALGLDKKREGGTVKWVLPYGIGTGRSGCNVPEEIVDRAIDWIVEGAA